MTRIYRFKTGHLAGAFIGVLNTLGFELRYPARLGATPVDLEVGWRLNLLEINSTTAPAAVTIPSSFYLDAIIDEVLGMKSAVETLHLGEGGTGNPTPYEVIISRDGSITVGCKSFSKEGADRISGAIKAGSEDFEFITDRVQVRCEKGRCQFDSDGGLKVRDLRQLIALRDNFLAQQTTRPPFHLFS